MQKKRLDPLFDNGECQTELRPLTASVLQTICEGNSSWGKCVGMHVIQMLYGTAAKHYQTNCAIALFHCAMWVTGQLMADSAISNSAITILV